MANYQFARAGARKNRKNKYLFCIRNPVAPEPPLPENFQQIKQDLERIPARYQTGFSWVIEAYTRDEVWDHPDGSFAFKYPARSARSIRVPGYVAEVALALFQQFRGGLKGLAGLKHFCRRTPGLVEELEALHPDFWTLLWGSLYWAHKTVPSIRELAERGPMRHPANGEALFSNCSDLLSSDHDDVPAREFEPMRITALRQRRLGAGKEV